jgi:tRNA U34 5-methylaminomethyl-2-thiouridine-forming methyltransferase MnmC
MVHASADEGPVPGEQHAPDASPGPDVVVTADGSRTLRSGAHGQTYKSRLGALTESRSVFLEGSGVAARLAGGEPTCLLEIGFGTGLNFLVTVEAARVAGTKLHYVAVESDLLPAATLRALAYHEALAPSPFPAAFVEWRAGLEDEEATSEPGPASTLRRYRWDVGPITLDLVIGNVLDDRTWESLPAIAAQGHDAGFGAGVGAFGDAGFDGGLDAIYHDAFSPSVASELWSPVFLARLASVLAPGGRLVSYSVAGAVRRALAEAGLEVRKAPGPPGGKAEVLVATRPGRGP